LSMAEISGDQCFLHEFDKQQNVVFKSEIVKKIVPSDC